MNERRQQGRVTVNHEFDTIADFISEYVSDISRTGIFIRSDDPLPKGTRVDLRFSIIVDDIETIEGIGEVVRVIPPGGDEPPGMGVNFTELTDASRALVDRLLAQHKDH